MSDLKVCPDPLCDHIISYDPETSTPGCEHCDWCWDPASRKPRTMYSCGSVW